MIGDARQNGQNFVQKTFKQVDQNSV